MALLVLLSTLSITIEKHYCANTLVDVAVFTKVKSCCSASSSTKPKAVEGSCCKNETDLVVGQDELTLTKPESFNPTQQLFVVAMAHVFSSQTLESATEKPDFSAYTPPDLRKDIHVLNEVFLI